MSTKDVKVISHYEAQIAAARFRPVYAKAVEILRRQDQLLAEVEALEAQLVKLCERDEVAWSVALNDTS